MSGVRLLIVGWLLCGSVVCGAAQDPYAAAMRAYREKDYAAYLENMRRVSEAVPHNVELRELLARAYALNNRPAEAIATLQAIAKLGAAATLDHEDLALLKGNPALTTLQAAFAKNKAPINNSRTAFTLAERDLIPEGIAYDEKEDAFYVGSIFKHKIVRVTRGGKAEDFTASGQDGLMNVLGMKVDAARRLLWVCVSSGPRAKEREGAAAVFKYDLRSRRLVKKYERHSAEQKHLFNDIVISRAGDVFLTDSLNGGVWMIGHDADALEPFTNAGTFIYPNGIALTGDKRYLFVADARGIHRLDLKNQRTEPLKHADTISLAGFDGLYWHEGGLLGVQNGFNPERIVRVTLNQTLDRTENLTVLEANNPLFEIPTTGALARGGFYYIANSQLRALNEQEEIPAPDKLKAAVVLRLPLPKR